jgi:hypothetical protein
MWFKGERIETWSPTVMDGNISGILENGVLRGSNREWRKPHKEKLNNFNSSTNTVKMLKSKRWVGHELRER